MREKWQEAQKNSEDVLAKNFAEAMKKAKGESGDGEAVPGV